MEDAIEKICLNKSKEEDTREKILSAAIKLFAKNGFEGTSIREICALANVNISMISYYFGGKKELYQGIIDNLILKQLEYSKAFINYDIPPNELSKEEQIKLLYLIIDKFVDFFYSSVISKDHITMFLKEQQNSEFVPRGKSFKYLRELIAAIFEKDANSREMIFQTLFIVSQINSARVLPVFSLNLLGQTDFTKEDIETIKANVKFYIDAILKEAKIV